LHSQLKARARNAIGYTPAIVKSHAFTAHITQGQTIEGTVYFDMTNIFNRNIPYSAITRPRSLDKIVLFQRFTAPAAIPDVDLGGLLCADAVAAISDLVPAPVCDPLLACQFYSPYMTSFKEPNMVRCDLGGAAGNRCFNFSCRAAYYMAYPQLVRDLVDRMGSHFNLNEMPHDATVATRCWLDIDIPLSRWAAESIQAALDAEVSGGSNVVLQSPAGKIHATVNIPHNALALHYFRDVLYTAEVACECSEAEWLAGFDIGARGLRAAHSIKVKGGRVVSTGAYALLHPTGDIVDDVIAASIYREATGALSAEAMERLDEIRVSLEIDAGIAERNRAARAPSDIALATTQEQLDAAVTRRDPKRNWMYVVREAAKASTAIPGFNPHRILHEWSAAGDHYDAAGNDSLWAMWRL
jgi:hypothetical protein